MRKRIRPKYARADAGWRKQIDQQRFKYNLLGIFALTIIILLATNAGGCAQALSHMLTGNGG